MIDLNNRFLVFTDLHFGIHSNSQSYIDICADTMKWIKDKCSTWNISDILFMGDFFDSRASIDVKTLNNATQSLYDLADNGIRICMILGNHDIYLRDSTSIHSLFAFNGYKGITVLDKPFINDECALLPWQFGTSSGSQIDIPDGLKYVFCHHNFPVDFFFNSAGKARKKSKKSSDTFVNKNKYVDEYGFQKNLVETVINNKGFIFSGHIHNRMEVPIGESGESKIIIEGSPYETSWGFGNVECGAYIVDTINGVYEFVANPFNRKHVEIRTSEESNFDNIDFENSIVRLTVDTQESFDTISKIQAKIQQKKPFAVENTKYEFTVAEFVGNSSDVTSNMTEGVSNGVSSKLDYVKKAIDAADFSSFTYTKNGDTMTIDKNRLKEIATNVYESKGAK